MMFNRLGLYRRLTILQCLLVLPLLIYLFIGTTATSWNLLSPASSSSSSTTTSTPLINHLIAFGRLHPQQSSGPTFSPINYVTFSPAHRSRIVNQIKGKQYLILQVDNRVHLLQNRSNFQQISTSFLSSSITLSRWAKENNYGYLFFAAPQRVIDPKNHTKTLGPLWHKVPAMILVHQLAREAGVSAVLTVDTDISPSHLHSFRNKTYPLGLECSPRTEKKKNNNTTTNKLTTLEQFLNGIEKQLNGPFTESSTIHFILCPAHATAATWLKTLRIPDHSPTVNSGAILFRPTDIALQRLKYWFLESTQSISRLEVARTFGRFHLYNVTAQLFKQLQVRSYGRLITNPHRPFKSTFEDFRDDSICSPLFRVDFHNETTERVIGRFFCRGKNLTMMYEYWNEICSPGRLIEIFKLPSHAVTKCLETRPSVKSQLNVWPGDQGRLQEMILVEHFRPLTKSVFYVSRNGPLLSSAGSKEQYLLFHWGGLAQKQRAAGFLNRYLMEASNENECIFNENKWIDQVIEEFKSLPAFRLSQKMENYLFEQQEHLIFNESKSSNCDIDEFKKCPGEYLQVANM